MGSLGGRPHALVIPLPHQGHWNPMKIFIRQLVSMNISITVLASPERIAELLKLKNQGEFDRVQHVELVQAFSDPPKVRFLRTVDSLEKMKLDYRAQPALKEKMLAQKSAGYGPTFLVADMFLYWSQVCGACQTRCLPCTSRRLYFIAGKFHLNCDIKFLFLDLLGY